jgi:hypothetical protein
MSQQIELLITEATKYLGVEETPKNSNRGVCIDYWIRECGLDPALGLPWCAAYVGQMGRQALGTSWPVPRTASVAAIAAWAATRPGVLRSNPRRGDLFLLWNESLKRFAHIGIVTEVEGDVTYRTIEGNTNGGGSREGSGVFARVRRVDGRTKFVRWETA